MQKEWGERIRAHGRGVIGETDEGGDKAERAKLRVTRVHEDEGRKDGEGKCHKKV